jgi:hypothetical protein
LDIKVKYTVMHIHEYILNLTVILWNLNLKGLKLRHTFSICLTHFPIRSR